MPPRTRINLRLSRPEDETPEPSTRNAPTQNLTIIAEGLEHEAFGDIPEVQLQHPTNNNTSTTAADSSQNAGGANSTQTNRGTPQQLPPRAPSPIQVIQGNAELK
jgi:hypothetical protein